MDRALWSIYGALWFDVVAVKIKQWSSLEKKSEVVFEMYFSDIYSRSGVLTTLHCYSLSSTHLDHLNESFNIL